MKETNIIKNLKTPVGLLLMCVVFLFLPTENRLLIFHATMDQGFGKFSIETNIENYVIVKNTNKEKIEINPNSVEKIIFRHFDKNNYLVLKPKNYIPPNCFALISYTGDSHELMKQVSAGGKFHFEPLELKLLTAGEEDLNFMFGLLIIVLTIYLTWVITTYVREAPSL